MSHRSYAESPRRVTRSRGIPCGEGETEILFKSGTGRRSNAKQPAVSRQIDTKFRAPRGCLAVSQPLPVSPAKAGAQPNPTHLVHIPGSRLALCASGKTVAALFAREGGDPDLSRLAHWARLIDNSPWKMRPLQIQAASRPNVIAAQ